MIAYITYLSEQVKKDEEELKNPNFSEEGREYLKEKTMDEKDKLDEAFRICIIPFGFFL